MDMDAWVLEKDEIDRIFPDARFSIDMPLSELDVPLAEGNTAIIKCTHNCYCYAECHRPADFIFVKTEANTRVLVRDALAAMVKAKYDPDCGHCFFEGFKQTKDSTVQFDTRFGS